MKRRRSAPTEIITKVNVTPIIDVALVLVIILLVTAPLLSTADLPVSLPEARTREAEDQRNVSVTLGRDGSLAVDDRIVARAELAETVKRPLESETWAGCIDAVGGAMLARVLGQLQYGGSVAAVGLAGGAGLPASVIPFLLRGVNLLGIDSVTQPYAARQRAWGRIARDLPMAKLEAMIQPARLEDLPELGRAILAGQVKGRVVVDVQG